MLQKILIFAGFCLDFDAFCEGLEMKKNRENCVTVCKFRVLAFWSWDCISGFIFAAEGFKMEPTWEPKQPEMKPKDPKRYPRRFQKNMKKKLSKLSCRPCEPYGNPPSGPLKEQFTRQADPHTADRQTPDR